MSAEVEEMLKRFQACKNIIGYIIIDKLDGIPIKSSLDNTTTLHYAALIQTLNEKAHQVVLDLDATNEFTFLRMRTLKHEIMVSPGADYVFIAIQDPSD